MSDLEPCPCGQTPKKLEITYSSSGGMGLADGDCCGYWSVDFVTEGAGILSPRCMALAIAAWNEAPRGGK